MKKIIVLVAGISLAVGALYAQTGGMPEPIKQNATDKTYVPIADDVGWKLAVVVTANGYEGELAKVTDAAVQKKEDPIPNDKIEQAHKAMKGFEGQLNASGWRSTKGDFNWKRLGIDMGGATIVGAGAGVLTNIIMKNSQLKSGYGSIECVYGSPQTTVAYGTSFVVR